MWFPNSWAGLEKMANHATSSNFLGAAERPPFWVSAVKIWGETVSWFISCSQSIFPISWHLSADMHQKWCDILWSKFANVSLMFWATWSQNFIQFCLAVFEIGRGEPRKRSTLYLNSKKVFYSVLRHCDWTENLWPTLMRKFLNHPICEPPKWSIGNYFTRFY